MICSLTPPVCEFKRPQRDTESQICVCVNVPCIFVWSETVKVFMGYVYHFILLFSVLSYTQSLIPFILELQIALLNLMEV